MVNIGRTARAFWRDESGVSAVEYAALLAFVGVGIVFATGELSDTVTRVLDLAAGCLTGTVSSSSC